MFFSRGFSRLSTPFILLLPLISLSIRSCVCVSSSNDLVISGLSCSAIHAPVFGVLCTHSWFVCCVSFHTFARETELKEETIIAHISHLPSVICAFMSLYHIGYILSWHQFNLIKSTHLPVLFCVPIVSSLSSFCSPSCHIWTRIPC